MSQAAINDDAIERPARDEKSYLRHRSVLVIDDEGDQADREQGRDHDHQAMDDVTQQSKFLSARLFLPSLHEKS